MAKLQETGLRAFLRQYRYLPVTLVGAAIVNVMVTGEYGLSLVLIVLASELGVLRRVLGTTPLTGGEWLGCRGGAVALCWSTR